MNTSSQSADDGKQSPDHPTKPRRTTAFPWRFGLGHLMLAMTVCCVAGAGLSYLSMALRGQRSMQLVFILFSVAGPVLVLVIVSLLVQLTNWWKHR